MPIPAIVPNPYDDDEKRQARMESSQPISSRRGLAIVLGGCAALIAFAVAVPFGYPGTGAVLVPIGMLLIIGGGIELLLSHL